MIWEVSKAKDQLIKKLGAEACINTISIKDIKCSSATMKEFLKIIALYIDKNGLKSLILEGFPRNLALYTLDEGYSILNILV